MKRILFIAAHRKDRAPNQRFRFEQFLEYFHSKGIETKLSNLITVDDDKYFYKKGHLLKKVSFVIRSKRQREKDIEEIKNGHWDLVYICREALMTRSWKFEKKIAATGIPSIFDIDDAIWISNVSNANRWFKWMKDPNKTNKIMATADLIFAGNQYLANYALKYNPKVEIIPTTIDTDEYKPQTHFKDHKTITIGWSGSITTMQHFEYATSFLKILKEKYGNKINIKVIGDGTYKNEELNIQGLPWKKDTELADLSSFEIGIMPLPDDEWAKGKCGLKGLQYMALGIPTIMSPVGVNSEIIQDGENGFLACTENEWVEKISQLIDSEELRVNIGKAGRETVVKKYSKEVWKDIYIGLFENLMREKNIKS